MHNNTITRRTVGTPTGPKMYLPELGCEVPTFVERPEVPVPYLKHHVPHILRGHYRPRDLGDYTGNDEDYPTNANGFVMCGQPNKKARSFDPKTCQKQAVNRSGVCENHGGRLHPLDKVAPGEFDPSKMTRWQQLTAGIIDVDDLDDEELIRGMCRRPNGTFAETKNAPIPRKIYDKMVNRLFDRAQEKFRENLLQAVEQLAVIATGDAFEPTDQIKAISIILDRALGKAPDKVELTVGAKPYEQILQGLEPITREQSRARRAQIERETPLEAEVVDVRYSEADGDTALATDAGSGGTVRDVPAEGYDDADRKPLRRKKVQRVGEPRMTRKPVRRKEVDKATREEEVKRARNRRYAARAMGRTTTRDLPYERIGSPLPEGGWRIQWIAPSDVKAPKAR